MPVPAWTSADFLAAFLRLLPRGRAWPKEADATLPQALAPLMPVYSRQAARAAYLLQDAFPATSSELLPEWLETLGLPGAYASLDLTQSQLQQLAVSRIIGGGGQSPSYFIALAATLGYAITIQQFSPFHVGMAVGLPIYGDAWAYVWQVNGPTFSVDYFLVGRDAVGEPLASWSNTVLQSEFSRLKPAHTTVLFNYS